MVAEGLPLVLVYVLPSRAPWTSFAISTTAIALFGEIMPQAIMPLYVLEIGGRTMWFLKCIMWILAIPACIPAYALSRFKSWRNRENPEKTDGILEEDELVEFMRLHEQSQCHGGPLTDDCGSMVRAVLLGQHRIAIEDVRPISHVKVADANASMDVSTLTNLRSGKDPYLLVLKAMKTQAISDQEDDLKAEDKAQAQDTKLLFDLEGILCSRVLISLL